MFTPAAASRLVLSGTIVSGRSIQKSLTRSNLLPCVASSLSVVGSTLTVAPLATILPPSRSFSSKPPKRASKLTGAELDKQISSLPGWAKSKEREVIVKSFVFDDFNQAFSVMTRVALLAEKMNHHPKWTNVYNQLKVELETHDASGISDFDIYMAQQIELYVAQIKKPAGSK